MSRRHRPIESLRRVHSEPKRLVFVASVAIALTISSSLGVALAASHHSTRAVITARAAAKHATAHARMVANTTSSSAMVTDYVDMGISYTLTPQASLGSPPPAAASSSAALASFKAQGVPQAVVGTQLSSQTPTVQLAEVTDTSPQTSTVTASVPYLAWVVTYTGLPTVSYGPVAPPSGATQNFVGIMQVSTATWTEFFSDSPTG